MLRRCFIADLRRGWWMYLIVIALLTLVGVMGVSIFTNFSIDDDFDYYKAEKYQTIYGGTLPIAEYEELKAQGKVIGHAYNTGYSNDTWDIDGHVIDYAIAQAFDSPPLMAGKWFDGSGPQAIVPSSMAEQYPIGSTFEFGFRDEKGEQYIDTVTVIGHFKYDGAFRIDASYTAPYFDAVNKGRITICAKVDRINISNGTSVIYALYRLSPEEANAIERKYEGISDAQLISLHEEYELHMQAFAPQVAASVYMYYTLFAGSAIVIITTSVSNGEYRKRRMATNMLCGANTRNLVWTEWIRTAICIVVAISLTIWLTYNLQSSEMMRTNPANLWKGALILIGVGMLIALINCVRIIRTKMLDVIGGK